MWRARWSVRCVSCAPASWRSPTGRSSGHGRSDDGEFVAFPIHKELSMNEKTASVHWEGQGKKGLGKISTETGARKDYPYGFASRFEDDRRGTNPEEILGAAVVLEAAREAVRIVLQRAGLGADLSQSLLALAFPVHACGLFVHGELLV